MILYGENGEAKFSRAHTVRAAVLECSKSVKHTGLGEQWLQLLPGEHKLHSTPE